MDCVDVSDEVTSERLLLARDFSSLQMESKAKHILIRSLAFFFDVILSSSPTLHAYHFSVFHPWVRYNLEGSDYLCC